MRPRARRWAVALAMGIGGVVPTQDVIAMGTEAASGEQLIAAPASPSSPWALRVPRAGAVVFQGLASFDDAGVGNHFVLYPAPNVIGLVAAMVTHGALVESAKKENRERIQAASDAILAPYKAVLDGFSHEDLLRRALRKLPTGTIVNLVAYDSEPATDSVVDVAPAFSLTPDQRAIVLNIAITIGRRSVVDPAQFRSDVRIVSNTADTADPKTFWNANDGEKLKDLSALLVAESLEIVFRAAAGGTPSNLAQERTVRFMEGSAERIERAQVLENKCGRLLIRNLRGLLMSVPATVPSGERAPALAECAVKTAVTN
jgi:hypothetical protein